MWILLAMLLNIISWHAYNVISVLCKHRQNTRRRRGYKKMPVLTIRSSRKDFDLDRHMLFQKMETCIAI